MEIKIDVMALDVLTPYQKNVRKHTDKQIDQIAASMRNFGFTVPILQSENIIIAGHGRYEAAKRIYASGEKIKLANGDVLPIGKIPAIDCSKWTEKQRRAYALADNRLNELSDWDNELLAEELSFLDDDIFDFDSIGFSLPEIDDILGEPEDAINPEDEWQNMPEFVQDDKQPKRTIKVHFETEADVQAFAKCVGQQITDRTKYIWFPYQEKNSLKDKRYISNAA